MMAAKEWHKETMVERIKEIGDDALLTKIPATAKGISWLEDDREFTYNGVLYDLVKQVSVEGVDYLLCVPDGKEAQIIAKHNAYNQNSGGKEAPAKAPSFNLLQVLSEYLPVNTWQIAALTTDNTKNIHAFPYNEALYSTTYAVNIPPPKGC